MVSGWYQQPSHPDDDEGADAVVYLGEPIHSGYVLIQRDHLATVTSLEHERRKRAHAEFRRLMGIRSVPLEGAGTI